VAPCVTLRFYPEGTADTSDRFAAKMEDKGEQTLKSFLLRCKTGL